MLQILMQVHACSCTRNLETKMADSNADTDNVATVLTVIVLLANLNESAVYGCSRGLQTDRRLTHAAAGVADGHEVISNFLHVYMASFQLLLTKVAPLTARTGSNMHQCISLGERMTLALR